jgi:hypothetical protein
MSSVPERSVHFKETAEIIIIGKHVLVLKLLIVYSRRKQFNLYLKYLMKILKLMK